MVNKYEIISELGRGGMSIVYLAEHRTLHNKVAIKLLNKELLENDNIRKRFLAEARNMARMSHPNIIKVTDLIEESDTVAFVMEYIDCLTLREYIESKIKLDDEEIEHLFKQILDAVGYVHSQSLIHRDIKPSNVLVDKQGKIKLMDFGIAKEMDADAAEYTLTRTSVQMGTPMYMSPEQVKSSKHVTYQTDIYSLGVVLWQMVSGKKPYSQSELSILEIQYKIIKEPLPLLNCVWDSFIQQATEKIPELRYANIGEMIKSFHLNKDLVYLDDNKEKTLVDINGAKDTNVEINEIFNSNKVNSSNYKTEANSGKTNLLNEVNIANPRAQESSSVELTPMMFFGLLFNIVATLLTIIAYYRIYVVYNYYSNDLFLGTLLYIPGVFLVLLAKNMNREK
jgi:serine/threonine protein kinase